MVILIGHRHAGRSFLRLSGSKRLSRTLCLRGVCPPCPCTITISVLNMQFAFKSA
jgi:hypothetical protein